jgi:4-hydroxy-4-methyl-2-oxoglutarate aldolase
MTNTPLSPQEIEDLRAIDTPTICNAIETFNVRSRLEGFLGMDIRCLLPDLGSMIGYAVTATVDSTTPEASQDEQAWLKWMQAMQASFKPAVLVFKDIGPQPRKSAHLGEVMGTIARRLGVIGIVTDGGVRDILELRRLTFHCFAAGLTPSHGNPRLLEFNCPVVIDGVRIESGDLLHGDINGVTIIPRSIASEVAAAAARIRQREAEQMAYVNSPEFTLEGLHQWRLSH